MPLWVISKTSSPILAKAVLICVAQADSPAMPCRALCQLASRLPSRSSSASFWRSSAACGP